jgi:lipopolysaccharide/colanic/teichoic acid biosynthesis glycosyltransferase
VTEIGRLLRRWSIDELPQLLNVLRGDMSMVGPRPPLPDEVARYEPWHLRRLRVRPGLTGVWQVSGRSNVPFDEAVRLDLFYIENWSLGTDLWLLARTIPAVLRRLLSSGRAAQSVVVQRISAKKNTPPAESSTNGCLYHGRLARAP